ncbi:A24 family peptidase [Qipengyuania sp. CAU 1752]
MNPASVGAVVGIVALLLAAWAAVTDIRHRKIRNWNVLAVAVACLVQTLLVGGLEAVGWATLHAVIALVVGMWLFKIGFIGAGDAKFYAALALAVPIQAALLMLGWTSVAGLLLLIFMALLRRARRSKDGELQPEGPGWTVPYGVAIFAGYVATTM